MKLYAISDLHLSFGTNKPMNIFGKVWDQYEDKIKMNWLDTVSNDDVVLIPGDISWAMTLMEAKKDFAYIDQLPGKKIIMRGNHDYYFATKTKVEKFFLDNKMNSISVLHNNAYDLGHYIICGTRGWSQTESDDTALNKKIIAREEARLKSSLIQGSTLRTSKNQEIIVAMHFPPFIGNFQSIMKEYGVKTCIYGHLHGYGAWMIKEGMIDGICYKMVSCDHTNFKLVELP